MDETMGNQQGKTMAEVMPNIAYSLGAYLGDGYHAYYYYGNGGWYMVEVSTMDAHIVMRVQREVKALFGVEYKIKQKKLKSGTKMFIFRATRQFIYNFFNLNTDFRNAVPRDIREGTADVKRHFLAGLFDTDGSVAESNSRWQLKFGSTRRPIIEAVAAILQSLNVQVGKISDYTKKGYRTLYSIQPNLMSWVDAKCYFEVPRKQDRVDRYLKHMFASETMHTAPSIG